jgi:methyl-accepting chemotaxis protein
MSELAGHFESRVQGIIKEVVTAASNLKRVSEQMSGVIGGVSSKATDVVNVAGQTSQNVSSVASSAEEMSISVHDVADQIAKSTQAVHAAVDAKDRANEVSRALETAAGKIGEIVDSIQKIAGQINLLALNAMIESARAGEAGKGFAVVANEVKMLATATTTATEDISNHVVNIQDVSSQVIKSLEAINTAIQAVDSYSSSIAATIKQQTAATNEIASNMTAAAGRTRQIVTDISEVKQASAGANESANHVFEAVKVLYVQTEKLSKEVVGFLGEIRAA